MVYYNIYKLDHTKKEITFIFDGDSNKTHTINVFDGFKEYVVATNLEYFVDLNNGDLVRIPGADNHLNSLRNDYYDLNGSYFRKALQCDIDKDDLDRFNGDNGKMYKHLENIYNTKFTEN